MVSSFAERNAYIKRRFTSVNLALASSLVFSLFPGWASAADNARTTAVAAQVNPILRDSPGAITAADAPNLFGSVALPILHTSLDAKWRAVNHAPLHSMVAAGILNEVRSRDLRSQMERVNALVNRRLSPADDAAAGVADHWAAADESLSLGKGDCEDYAIAKMQILRAAGYNERDLYLVVVKDLVRRSDHALLAVRLEGQLYILDSATDEILASDVVKDYAPLMSFSGDRSWIHGYRAKPELLIADQNAAGD